jgi:hypothetical protein
VTFNALQRQWGIGFDFVAVNTTDSFICVAATVPIIDDAVCFGCMAFYAGYRLVGEVY